MRDFYFFLRGRGGGGGGGGGGGVLEKKPFFVKNSYENLGTYCLKFDL